MSTFPLIVNNFSHPIILADNRSWTQSYERHLETTGLGGDDLAYPLNTPVRACAAGTWEFDRTGTMAGNVGRIRMSNGWAVVFEHLNSESVAPGTKVTIGKIVAKSGNSGGVLAHLHVHVEDPSGMRHPIYQYFSTIEVAGGGGVIVKAPTTQKENTMLARTPKNYYDIDFMDVEPISQPDAAVAAKLVGLAKVPMITSEQMRGIIASRKARKIAWMSDQADAVGQVLSSAAVAKISEPYDAISADEDSATFGAI
jgi:hypothetical protein